jgi:hypothetical protein
MGQPEVLILPVLAWGKGRELEQYPAKAIQEISAQKSDLSIEKLHALELKANICVDSK